MGLEEMSVFTKDDGERRTAGYNFGDCFGQLHSETRWKKRMHAVGIPYGGAHASN